MALWPDYLTTSFQTANQDQNASTEDSDAYYDPFIRLLYRLLGPDSEGSYDIKPQYHTAHPPPNLDDVAVPLIFKFDKTQPVLFMEIRAPVLLSVPSHRETADVSMRNCCHFFKDIGIATSRLPAISAFGTRVAFYKYDVQDTTLAPPRILPDPSHLNDVAPAERWNYDVIEEHGVAKLRQVIDEVKQMCDGLSGADLEGSEWIVVLQPL